MSLPRCLLNSVEQRDTFRGQFPSCRFPALAARKDFSIGSAQVAHLVRKAGGSGWSVCDMRGQTDEKSLFWCFLLVFYTEVSVLHMSCHYCCALLGKWYVNV